MRKDLLSEMSEHASRRTYYSLQDPPTRVMMRGMGRVVGEQFGLPRLRQPQMLAFVLLTALSNGAAAESACPVPPPPVTSLTLTRFYADKTGSVVDPALAEQHKAETAPLTLFLRHVTQDADKALRRTKPADKLSMADCGLQWLASWAQANALTGKMGGPQAESERKWDMTGAALAYLKLKPYASDAQRRNIEPWLIKMADDARAVFDDTSHKRNNHWYWLGLGLGAVAEATGSDKHWQQARGIFADAARDIAADGSLPMELARGQRALHYHAFALMPLVTLAEIAHARGEDFDTLGNGALDRLVRLTLKGIADPAVFDRLAGVAQERPVNPGSGWLPLYLERHMLDGVPHPSMQPGHRWLGGDVMTLAAVLKERARSR